jgi:preprotein translocase subunit SecA
MVIDKESLTQTNLNFAIVDEVDSILIDEARTPLIISGQGDKSTELYGRADKFVKRLRREDDFTMEEKDRTISLTDAGVAQAEKEFNVENLSDPENMEINHHIIQALKARNLMQRDVDYIEKDGEIVIVDEFTGRLMFGRRYSDGLHQAIEAKEGLHVRQESRTLATITIQNYFRMYQKLSGMTGTAKTEEEEFRDIYNMDVVEIPTNKEIIREDLQDSIYATEKGKFAAIVDRIIECHEKGQPVLVGTISIEKSELIGRMLDRRGVKYNILNAKHHEKEAEIVSEAGRLASVTIATNMAGRGTDIILGGNPDFEAKREMRKGQKYDEQTISYASGMIPLTDPALQEARETYRALYAKFKEERAREQQEVLERKGLHIIGTERHESRRIDNQLRGRSGRQGDPGSTQFFISMEDDLMRLFGGERMQGIVERLGVKEDEPIEAKMLTKSIENAQKRVEGRNFSIRKYVLQYDNVMNKQREVIYSERRKVLNGEDLREHVMSMAGELVEEAAASATVGSKYAEEWDFDSLWNAMRRISARFSPPRYEGESLRGLTAETLRDDALDRLERLYAEKEEEIGAERMRDLERMILLRVVDTKWMDHIDAMDQLRHGIGLRALGQQDPAKAYAAEGFDMFELMISSIREDTVRYCFNVTIQTNAERRQVVAVGAERKADYADDGAQTQNAAESDGQALPSGAKVPDRARAKQETIRREGPKLGRNDPCPCGSGKKYKNCCGSN